MKIFIVFMILIVIAFVVISVLCFAKAAHYADEAFAKMKIKNPPKVD